MPMLTIKCLNCSYVYRSEKKEWEWLISKDRCPCCGSPRLHLISEKCNDNNKNGLFDSYTYYSKAFDNQLIFRKKETNIIKEDKNMKKEQKVENQEPKLNIYRINDTSRGIFKVKDLEPTDMFVLVCDEKQSVYMAVSEEEPKYKTKKAVIKMVSGELSWVEDDTLVHVYRRPGVELHVGDFEYPND